MSSSIHIFGATEVHAGELDKPNEDSLKIGQDWVVIADGITRSRRLDGGYPTNSALLASEAFTEAADSSFKEMSLLTLAEQVKVAVRSGNEAVLAVNVRHGLTPATVDYCLSDYFGTTGIVLLVGKTEVALAYAGDPIGIHLPSGDAQALLTVDQLHNCHAYAYATFVPADQSPASIGKATHARQLWQRSHARNKPKAEDSQGRRVGFGAFTGEPEVFEFVTLIVLPRRSGDRFLLMSDAARALIDVPEGAVEAIGHYADLLHMIECCGSSDVPATLIRNIREAETRKGLRSDDATVAVIEVP